jgi:hypothetical protein
MRLIKTAVATLALVAITGSAFAAGTRDSLTVRMGGTARVASGGKLKLTLVRRTSTAKQFKVTIRYDVTVRSKTVLGFTAYPCRSTSCINSSISDITLFPGLRHVTFTGHVPVVRRDDGSACVYVQVRDKGPKGRKPGKIVHHAKLKGVSLCRSVPERQG